MPFSIERSSTPPPFRKNKTALMIVDKDDKSSQYVHLSGPLALDGSLPSDSIDLQVPKTAVDSRILGVFSAAGKSIIPIKLDRSLNRFVYAAGIGEKTREETETQQGIPSHVRSGSPIESIQPIPGAYPLLEFSVHDSNVIPKSKEMPTGFILGNYNTNTRYAQSLLKNAAAERQVWLRFIPKLKDATIESTSIGLSLAGLETYSRFFLNQESSAVEMIKMSIVAEGIKGLFKPLESLGKVLAHPPSGEALATAIMKSALSKLQEDVTPKLESSDINPEARNGIMLHITKFAEALDRFEPESSFNLRAEECTNRWEKIVKLISFPLTGPNIYQHDIGGNKELAKLIDKKQKTLVGSKSFPEETGKGINNVMNSHRQSSINKNDKQSFYIFQGPAAVGKTYAAVNAANALDAHLIAASVKDLAAFLGVELDSKTVAEHYDYEVQQWLKPPGKIWDALVRNADNSNIMLFIDEFDLKKYPELLPAFKSWVTGEVPIYPGSRDVPESSNPSVIVASNHDVYAMLGDAAAQSRVKECVRFVDWPRDLLSVRAHEYLEKRILGMGIRYESATLAKTAQDAAKLLGHLLEKEKTYPLGTINLRDIEVQIDNTLENLQAKNDAEQQYSLVDEKENLFAKLELIVKYRPASDSKIEDGDKASTSHSVNSKDISENEERTKRFLTDFAHERGAELRKDDPEAANDWDKFRNFDQRIQRVALDSWKIQDPNKTALLLKNVPLKLLRAHCLLNKLPSPSPTPPGSPV